MSVYPLTWHAVVGLRRIDPLIKWVVSGCDQKCLNPTRPDLFPALAKALTTMGDKSTNFYETMIRDPLLEQATLTPIDYSFFLQHQSLTLKMEKTTYHISTKAEQISLNISKPQI